MKILGIDPGYAIVGWGIIEKIGNSFNALDYGAITTDSNMKLADRLLKISEGVSGIINCYSPDVMAIEELFYSTNAKTVINVGQGRGVCVVEGARAGIEVFEYTPIQVKQALTGYGRAEKKQMQIMVKNILGLDEIPKPDDVADALAVAITHANSSSYAFSQTATNMQMILKDLQEGSQQKNITWEQFVQEKQKK